MSEWLNGSNQEERFILMVGHFETLFQMVSLLQKSGSLVF